MKWYIPGVYQKLIFLIRYSPDVIFLQEVIPPYYTYLKKKASSYEIITGNIFLLFNLSFSLKNKSVKEMNQS